MFGVFGVFGGSVSLSVFRIGDGPTAVCEKPSCALRTRRNSGGRAVQMIRIHRGIERPRDTDLDPGAPGPGDLAAERGGYPDPSASTPAPGGDVDDRPPGPAPLEHGPERRLDPDAAIPEELVPEPDRLEEERHGARRVDRRRERPALEEPGREEGEAHGGDDERDPAVLDSLAGEVPLEEVLEACSADPAEPQRRVEWRVRIPEILAPERERHVERALRREAARDRCRGERARARARGGARLDARALELAKEPEVREEAEEATVEDEGGQSRGTRGSPPLLSQESRSPRAAPPGRS